MAKTMSAGEAQTSLDTLLQSVHDTREPVVIDREGEPVAVVINPEDFERYLRLEAAADWEALDPLAARNADMDPDEVFADVTAEIEALRRERRGADKRGA